MKIDPVFHINLLEPYRIPADSQRRIEPPEVEEIEGEENHVVREVADSRVNGSKKKVEYLVLWEGYEQEDATWEPWELLRNSTDKALISFHKRYPRKSRDARVVGLSCHHFLFSRMSDREVFHRTKQVRYPLS